MNIKSTSQQVNKSLDIKIVLFVYPDVTFIFIDSLF
jgi:hypothetical protein